jgi:hypothetical protein
MVTNDEQGLGGKIGLAHMIQIFIMSKAHMNLSQSTVWAVNSILVA